MSTIADTILGSDDLKKERVFVREWNVDVYVREMTAGERQEFLKIARDEKQHARAEAWLVALVACDETGHQIFTLDQVDKLMAKNAKALDTLGRKILEINKIGDEAIETEKKDSAPIMKAVSSAS